MKKGNRLKFVEVLGLTPVQRNLILASINKKLALPWWKKLYDWPGIVGQAIGLKWVNINGLNYCSEDAALHLRKLIDFTDRELREALTGIPKHGSPQDLSDYCQKNPNTFKTVGKWESDD